MKRYIWLFIVAGIIVVLDQYTKALVVANFDPGQFKVIIKGFFHITHSQNPGAAFGLLRDAPDIIRKPVLLILPILAFVIILWVLQSVKDKWRVTALALILGGAIGNVIDRFRLGYVTDFFRFFYKSWIYPSFNIADAAICVGFGIWVIHILFFEKKAKK
ncbi:signal peptidase II [Bdellovibrionota bacterium]